MIAVIASLFLLLYVLVPGGLFRLITSLTLPLKKFHKVRTQEITFSVIASFAAFWLAVALVWTVAKWPFPTPETSHQRREAYRTVFLSVDSDKALEDALSRRVFWPAANSVLKRQGRFLAWYYVGVGLTALGFSWLAEQYRKSGKPRWRDKIAARVLRPIISEWHVLLTNFGSPTPGEIELDVLSTDGILYKGKLSDYFFDTDGELAGILLSAASRYARNEYETHRKADFDATVAKWPTEPEHKFTKDRAQYWKVIPGADLFYIPSSRISNVNVRRVTAPADVPRATEARLVERKITGLVVSERRAPDVPNGG